MEQNVKMGERIELNKDYKYMMVFEYPGPLPCLSGIQEGCSKVVNAGSLGMGSFCDYMVVCAGVTVTVLYNEFRMAA